MCDFWFCHNCCYPHKDMAFPDWADRALVFTDKGVVGRRIFSAEERKTQPDASYTPNGGIHAITWNGFRIGDVRIRTFDGPSCMCSTPMMQGLIESCDNRFAPDPLVLACYFGLGCICCRYACHQPEAPGLYRATISSVHTTTVGDQDTSTTFPTASIEVLALARRPEEFAPRGQGEVRRPEGGQDGALNWQNSNFEGVPESTFHVRTSSIN